ncbi:MAG: hypothetical protein ACUVT9_05455 [Candidatus Bathycorpusculaceae bacterium]
MLEKLSIGQKIFVAALIFLVAVISVAAYQAFIPQHVTIAVTEISWSPLKIDWGTMHRGEFKSEMLQVTNVGSTPVTLIITTINIPTGVTLNHNYTAGMVLVPTETLVLNLTLTIESSAAPGDFNFDLTIEAVEYT